MSFKNCRLVGVNVDAEKYHAQTAARGSKEFIISPSSLRAFAQCPEEWKVTGDKLAEWRAKLEAAEDQKTRQRLRRRIAELEGDTTAKAWGSLLDCRLLTPQLFDTTYAVRPDTYETKILECPECGSVTEKLICRKCKCEREEKVLALPWSGRAEECQEWTEKQEAAGLKIVTFDDCELADEAVARLMANPTTRKAIECSDKQVHVAGEWHDRSGVVIPVQCLIDLAPRLDTEYVPSVEMMWPKCLGDFKTCATADIREFPRRVRRFGWHIQAGFDLDLYCAATGEDRTDWLLICQKNFGVWQPFKRILDQNFIDLGRAQYRQMLSNYAWCVKNNRWPTHDDVDEANCGFGPCVPDTFMAGDAQFAPVYMTPEDESEEDEPFHSTMPT